MQENYFPTDNKVKVHCRSLQTCGGLAGQAELYDCTC